MESRFCRRHLRGASTGIALVAALLVSACASGPALRPAPGADVVNGTSAAATTTVEGVRITARSGAWPGDADIEEAVTPMRVTIVNDGDHPLRVRYSDFALVTETGERFAALPPYAVKGSVSARELAGPYPAVPRPAFTARGFRVAYYYDPLYPTLRPYGGTAFYADPGYYRYYYPYWDRLEVELPTPMMLRRAVPEGVIEPGGELEGFLYFESLEDVPAGTDVRFHADLTDPRSGEHFSTLNLAFVTDGAGGAG